MEDLFTRVWEDIIGRGSGPLTFRLLMQPFMATILGIRDGLKDAQEGRPAYFWTIFSDPTQRRDLLQEGWKAVLKVFILAIVLDTVYQLLVFHFFYPGEALIVAFILAFLPYLLIRGPVNRLMRGR